MRHQRSSSLSSKAVLRASAIPSMSCGLTSSAPSWSCAAAPANSERMSTPQPSTWQAQNSLATRFMPSLIEVTRQTRAMR